MADRELDDVREELEALQAAFAAEWEKSSALEEEMRMTQAVVDRPIVVTPACRIDKFRSQPLKPGDATIY